MSLMLMTTANLEETVADVADLDTGSRPLRLCPVGSRRATLPRI
jgi:hypothetical protein